MVRTMKLAAILSPGRKQQGDFNKARSRIIENDLKEYIQSRSSPSEKCCKHPGHLKMTPIRYFPLINGRRSPWCEGCIRRSKTVVN